MNVMYINVHAVARVKSETMLLKFAIILLATTQLTTAVNLCQTPNGQSGDCKPINECQSLYLHFQNGSRSSITKYIKRSHCGFVDGSPKVCCPLGTDPANKTAADATFVTSDLLPSTKECGKNTQSQTYIIGGDKADLDEFPWMVLLEYRLPYGDIYLDCGGALINKKYVLTAAHCVNSMLVSVRLGEYDTVKDRDCLKYSYGEVCASSAVSIPVAKKIVYESYDDVDLSHDIALLRLEEEVVYSEFIKPICLPTTVEELYKTYVGKELVVAGWGLTETGQESNIKLKVYVPVQDLSVCLNKYRGRNNINLILDAGQLCAGGEKGKDSCTGDSGGPLMTFKLDKNLNPRWYVIGVVSYGAKNCGQKNRPAVYTKVSKYVNWIVDNLKP